MESFFKKRATSVAQGPSAPEAVQEIARLQSDERRHTDRIAKLEVEKALLQNLVDQVCGADDDEAKSKILREHIAELQQRNAELTQELQQSVEHKKSAEKEIAKLSKRCQAFEAALENAQAELKNADAVAAGLHSTTAAHADEATERLRSEVALRDSTIEELMRRNAKLGDDMNRQAREFEQILDKTTSAQASTMEELNDRSEELAATQHELAALRKHKDGGITSAMALRSAENALGIAELVEMHMSCVNETIRAVTSEHLEGVGRDLVAVMSEASLQRLALESEVSQLVDRVAMRDIRIGELTALHRQLEERLSFAEQAAKESQARAVELEPLVQQLSDLREEHAKLREELELKRDECNTVTRTFLDEQRQWSVKSKASSSLVRELQAQLQAKQQQHAPDVAPSSAPNVSSQAQQNSSVGSGHQQPVDTTESERIMIERVASLQEKTWMLESAKKSYEVELDRLAKELEMKDCIIRLHFMDAAQKAAQQKGKLGSSFFKPNANEVQTQMQQMVEATLTRNLELESHCDALQQQLQRLEECLAAAADQGFEVEPDAFAEREEVDHFS